MNLPFNAEICLPIYNLIASLPSTTLSSNPINLFYCACMRDSNKAAILFSTFPIYSNYSFWFWDWLFVVSDCLLSWFWLVIVCKVLDWLFYEVRFLSKSLLLKDVRDYSRALEALLWSFTSEWYEGVRRAWCYYLMRASRSCYEIALFILPDFIYRIYSAF